MQNTLPLPATPQNKYWFILTGLLLLLLAFIKCYTTTHDLYWPNDADFDRDMAFAQGMLDGHFGTDPSYTGEFLWYNPLLFSVEAGITSISGLPLHVVVVKAGTYLNLLSPVLFLLMVWVLFDARIAVAALLSYLFFASGNIVGWAAATYSPWLFPASFMQFIFYLNVLLCYKAFSKQTYGPFILLGTTIGISFLGHTAPTLIIILMMLVIQVGNMFKAFKQKNYGLLKKYLWQGIAVFIPFVLASFVLLYFIVGKYNLHVINRSVFEYNEGIFMLKNLPQLLKENISVSFAVAIIGFIWFYKNVHHALVRKILFSWLWITIGMYIYASVIPGLYHHYHINLPGTVPSLHFFFYFKALQSVFFGLGCAFLCTFLLKQAKRFTNAKTTGTGNTSYANGIYIIIILLCSAVYFPFYQNRYDFVHLREKSLERQQDKDQLAAYDYILQHISPGKVILCDYEHATFPVMATARKMVATGPFFSNPYLDYHKREADRNDMLSFLRTGQPVAAKQLFERYQVSFVLLPNKEMVNKEASFGMFSKEVFKNNAFTLLARPN